MLMQSAVPDAITWSLGKDFFWGKIFDACAGKTIVFETRRSQTNLSRSCGVCAVYRETGIAVSHLMICNKIHLQIALICPFASWAFFEFHASLVVFASFHPRGIRWSVRARVESNGAEPSIIFPALRGRPKGWKAASCCFVPLHELVRLPKKTSPDSR